MTRINVVDPKELSRQHLIAEYREITRLPGNLYDWLNRKSKPPSFDEIPVEYKLGTGHVKFFYNKFKFLEKRFGSIINEMLERGYHPNFTDSGIFRRGIDSIYYNDYVPTEQAIEINRQRIKERTK
jgi:deoxyribonuclease (pyrimidine dimer)